MTRFGPGMMVLFYDDVGRTGRRKGARRRSTGEGAIERIKKHHTFEAILKDFAQGST